jgi:SAM-dependent methyltransferase
MGVLHHLEDGAAVLREMERVLKPGGVLLVADFTRAGLELVARVHASEGREHPVGPITTSWAEGFLTGMGLEAVGSREGELHHVAVFRKPVGSAPSLFPKAFSGMARVELLRSLEAFAKNWLAHDGCWFLAAEERLGLETAMELDAAAWGRFAAAEARRIMEVFAIPEGGGLEAMERALGMRMYAFLNPQRTEWTAGRERLRFTMENCRVQEARRRKGLPDFPVDPRIAVRCLHCPPDRSEERGCAWEFSYEKEGRDG